ncbi:MAG: type II secretion system F family protein [Akkermansia sp.]
MAKYQYSALDHKGAQQTGSVQANNEAEAVALIKSKGLYLTEIVEEGKGKLQSAPKKKSASAAKKEKGKIGGKIKTKTLMIFTRQLATLIDAGLPLLQSLTVLAKQEPNPALKATVNALSDSVQGGSTFSESLAQHPRIFNKLFVNMVKAGELGGVMEIVLNRLADYQEKAQKLKSKIVSAMVYPTIVLFIAVGILIFLLLVIVPKFKAMFADMGTDLPMISKIVFGMSDWFFQSPILVPNFIWLFGIIAVGIGAFKTMSKSPKGRRQLDTLVLNIPLIGPIQRKSAITRFSRTLGTLVTSGVPILQALNITRETAGNMVVADAIERVYNSVKEGESIVTPMSSSHIFPPMVISMVDVGEETGQLPDMLLKVANVYDDEVDNAVGAMTSMLEPLMIVFLAVVVGGIVFAMFLPLLKVIESMG